MAVEVTIRHMDISDVLQERARKRAIKIEEAFPTVEFVRVVLDKDGPFYSSEVTVQGGRLMNADSKSREADMLTAIKVSMERAESQLRKQMDKLNEVH